MNLGNGCRGERMLVESGEYRCRIGTQLFSHGLANQLRGGRWHPVEQCPELVGECFGEDSGGGGDELAEFDVGGAHEGEGAPQLMRGAHLQGSSTPRFDQQSRARSGQPGDCQAKTPGLHAQWRLTQSDSRTGDLEIYRCAGRTRICPRRRWLRGRFRDDGLLFPVLGQFGSEGRRVVARALGGAHERHCNTYEHSCM
ncbi:Uncharacterised protein [Mycobacteroides abscessus subsp. abscessus]|nr:Uncharacterised protein [Mycobacteroides abscessus subsp. abscessus]